MIIKHREQILAALKGLKIEPVPWLPEINVFFAERQITTLGLNNENLEANILLKIDVQGYEKSVLEGAEELLKNTKVILTEVSFNELYKDQALFNEIIDFLKERGYYLAGIENISQSLKDGTFLQADVFFVRSS